MDFGLTEKQGTQTSGVGTPSFMAPEVIGKLGDSAHKTTGLEKASDIWSMAELLLKGVFDEDSVDIARTTKAGGTTGFQKELKRPDLVMDNTWIERKLEPKLTALQDSKQFKSFIQQTMVYDPSKRLTATQALEHQFLDLTSGDRQAAKKLLAKLIGPLA
jgi:serine/threonine protein kinase